MPHGFLSPGGPGLLVFRGDLGQERFEGEAHTSVCLKDGLTKAGLYVVRFLLSAMVAALPTRELERR